MSNKFLLSAMVFIVTLLLIENSYASYMQFTQNEIRISLNKKIIAQNDAILVANANALAKSNDAIDLMVKITAISSASVTLLDKISNKLIR